MATLKQKKVARDLLENPGKPIGKAMVDAGYTPATAKNPQDLTEAKGWIELMEKYLPDEKVLETHEKGLEAMKVISSHTEPDYEIPDVPTRLRAVELAYKIKGRMKESPPLPPGDKTSNTIIFVNFKNEPESQRGL